MSKPTHREKILHVGMRVVHERGFANASVRDITTAANVPNGSFTNHFASKEAFGLAILDLSYETALQVIHDTLRNDALEPIQRLLAYIDTNVASLAEHGVQNGCLIGNFGLEIGEHSELIRHRVADILVQTQAAVAYCLAAAVRSGALPGTVDCADLAIFIVGSLQGATLLSKAERSLEPLHTLRRMLISTVLR